MKKYFIILLSAAVFLFLCFYLVKVGWLGMMLAALGALFFYLLFKALE
jgi:hypothetical protein